MKIFCLYNNDCALELFESIKNKGNDVFLCNERIDAEWCKEQNFDLTISYTYRYIINKECITALNKNIVNLHNSFLPYNRGADPNLWSIIDNSPRGVTLHYIDERLDKGYIIAQKEVNDDLKNETLRSSYNNLDKAAKELFINMFDKYSFWNDLKKECVGKGTYHSLNDGLFFKNKIISYDENVIDFLNRIGIKKC